MNEKTKYLIKILIPIAIGGTVAIWLFRKDFNPHALAEVRFDSRAWWGILIAILFVAGRELGMAWRFRTLTNKRLTWVQSIRITMLCEFTSCVTPTSVGGSAASMIFMNREGIKLGQATSITLTTLFLDELFIAIITPIVFLLISHKNLFGFTSGETAHSLQVSFWIVYVVIAVWALILWIGIFKAPDKIKSILIKLFSIKFLRRWKGSVEDMGTNMVESSRALRGRGISFWLNSMGATALSWICRFLVVNALFWGLVEGADQAIVFGRQIIVWVLLMFTPTPGGSGVSEWIFKEYYGDILGSGALIMVLALTWRVLTYYIYLAIGVFLLPSLTKKRKVNG